MNSGGFGGSEWNWRWGSKARQSQGAEENEPERILSRGGIGAMISGALVEVDDREGQRSKMVRV